MKVAVIGAGYWGPNLIRNLSGLPEVEKVVVCDRDNDRLARARERFNKIDTTTDLDAVLGDDSIEAVAVAPPISTHAALGTRVLEAGKHVFVEKPMASNPDEARALIRLAEKNDRVLMVGHTFEYSPPVLKIKEIIDRGDIGNIFFITMVRVNLGLHQRDASVIWDLAPHDFSILFNWLGEKPSSITAIGRECVRAGHPDVAFVSLKFPSGVIANIEVAWLAPSKLRRTTVVGEKKMLVYDDTENIEKVKLYDQGVDFRDPETFGEFQLSYRTGDIVSPKLPSTEPLRSEMSHFLECVRTGAKPRTDGASGLRVVEALAAAEQSLRQGVPVTLDPERV